jgi:hypothetical protein
VSANALVFTQCKQPTGQTVLISSVSLTALSSGNLMFVMYLANLINAVFFCRYHGMFSGLLSPRCALLCMSEVLEAICSLRLLCTFQCECPVCVFCVYLESNLTLHSALVSATGMCFLIFNSHLS